MREEDDYFEELSAYVDCVLEELQHGELDAKTARAELLSRVGQSNYCHDPLLCATALLYSEHPSKLLTDEEALRGLACASASAEFPFHAFARAAVCADALALFDEALDEALDAGINDLIDMSGANNINEEES